MRRILTIALIATVTSALVFAGTAAFAGGGWPTWSVTKQLAHVEFDADEALHVGDGDVDGWRACYTMYPTLASTGTVVAYNLSTDSTLAVTADGLTEDQGDAEVQGSEAVVIERRSSGWGLYHYGTMPIESELITETPALRDLDMKDSVFAFAADIGAGTLSSGSVTSRASALQTPPMSHVEDSPVGWRIVYGYLDNAADLTVLDAGDQIGQLQPSVSGDYVAYREIDESTVPWTERIKVQSLADPSDVTVVASESATYVGQPSLDDDLVAWIRSTGSGYEVCAYDLSADEEIEIPPVSPEVFTVHVDGTKIYTSSQGDVPQRAEFYDTLLGSWGQMDYSESLWGFSADGGRFLYSYAGLGSESGLDLGLTAEPDIYVNAPSVVNYGAHPFISGWVEDQGIGLGAGELELQSSLDGQHWTTQDTAIPDGDGDFFFNADALTGVRLYRVRYLGVGDPSQPGSGTHLSAISDTEEIVAKARIGTPSAPSARIKRYRRFTSSGTISPSQIDVQAAGRIEIYRKVHGSWRSYGRVGTSFTSGGYRASLKFSSTGQFRYRMHFLGSNTNYPTYSGWRYVTVYK